MLPVNSIRSGATGRRLHATAVAVLFAFIAAFALTALQGAAPAVAAPSAGVATTAGTDFWVMFEPNNAGGQPALSFSITGYTATTGLVAWPDGTSSSFSVTPNQITTVDVPASVAASMQSLPIDGTGALGVHITAVSPVTVYGLNYESSTSGAFVGVPTSALGTRYRALTYKTTIGLYPGRMMAVATQDNTTVTVTPENTYGSRAAGTSYTVTLSAGLVYSIGAPSTSGSSSEMSGTVMTSDKPIAVFAGVDCGNIGQGFCDLESSELFPTTEWGTDFVVPRFNSATQGDPVRVQADQDATVVTVNGTVVATLNAGQFYETTTGEAAGGNTAISISTSKPVEVAEFMIYNSYGSPSVTGEPDELIVPPYQQFLSSYTVATPGTGFSFNGINIVIPTAATTSLRVDGAAVSPTAFATVSGTQFSTAQLTVGTGTHTLSAGHPFGAFVYGANDYNSYSYSGGAVLSPEATVSTLTLSSTAPTSAAVGQQACFTVTATDSNGNPVSGVRVDLTVTGANSGDSGTGTTGSNGTATVCYSGTNAGPDTVKLTSGSAYTTSALLWTQNIAPTVTPGVLSSMTVSPGVLSSMTVSPNSSSIVAGQSQTFTTTGADQYGKALGDVTAGSTFTITPDGTCTVNVCTASVVGTHTVTATDGSVSGTATLTVTTGGAAALAPLVSMTVSPKSSSIVAGQSRTFTATGADQEGNTLGDVTAGSTFTITPDGTCTANVCTASVVGTHTVTATNGSVQGTATLKITAAAVPGPLNTLATFMKNSIPLLVIVSVLLLIGAGAGATVLIRRFRS